MKKNTFNEVPKQYENLLHLPTAELLNRFGEGNATPGSGSAAALMALLASSIICALAKLTISSLTKKAVDEKNSEKAASIAERLKTAKSIVKGLEEDIVPQLKDLFEDDSREFQEAIDARKKRDNTTDHFTKKSCDALALNKLITANEILLKIADLSFEICDHGLSIWSIGLNYAKGDAGAGINGSLAAITTCLQVAYVNVQTLGKEPDQKEARKAKQACAKIQNKLIEKQREFNTASQNFYTSISTKVK
ncbi:cyclodeaminase/cyclohydrolase family protein [Komagataeibacter sp. SM21]|uniref:cyclodeaminase/cyclohydrolase family protein n=1 Tax=Komagataeibacter sp. SM21 TaxID=3242899 RepID=UPI00352961D8